VELVVCIFASLVTVQRQELRHHTDDHFFDTLSSRTCHGNPLPCNAIGACVSKEDANTVFALGDWEYNWVLHDMSSTRV
jgi:hypothetical protein